MAAKFVWAENGNLQAPNVRVEIINLQTHVEEKILPGKIGMFDPAWAPNSAQIAFFWTGRQEIGHTMGVYVVNQDGSGLRKIADGGGNFASNPAWAPHGNELIYDKRVRGFRQLFKIASDDGVPEQLTRRGDNANADWFNPAYALPVSPQPALLSTTWGQLKKENPDGRK